MSYSLLSPKMISFVSFPQASQSSMNLYCIYISELVYCPFVLCLVSKALCQPSVRKVISFVLVSSLKPVYREQKKKKKIGGGDSHCYVCPCLFCREGDVNELENKKSSARKQWVRPIFQDRFSATFFQALFFISRSLNSLEVVSYKTGNRFGESRHIENCA